MCNMIDMVTNECAKSNYDRLRINKALGIFRKLITTIRTISLAISYGSKGVINLGCTRYTKYVDQFGGTNAS